MKEKIKTCELIKPYDEKTKSIDFSLKCVLEGDNYIQKKKIHAKTINLGKITYLVRQLN